MTTSMLSYWRRGADRSVGSDLTGVDGGGDASRSELELARENERDDVVTESVETEFERIFELELALLDESKAATREEKALSLVRNCRIWFVRALRSSRVMPSDVSSCEIGDVWGSVIVGGGRPGRYDVPKAGWVILCEQLGTEKGSGRGRRARRCRRRP